jgi:hypothetical protein
MNSSEQRKFDQLTKFAREIISRSLGVIAGDNSFINFCFCGFFERNLKTIGIRSAMFIPLATFAM